MRREVPLILTFAFGTFIVLGNFIIWDTWKQAAESVNNWALIVIAFTYVLGVGNLLRIHVGKIVRQEAGWGYSATTIAGLLVMLLFGIVLWFLPQAEGGKAVQFRALADVEPGSAVQVAAPSGLGDRLDTTVDSELASDLNGDGSAQAGDVIAYAIHYAYSGADELPSAPFTLTYDPARLEPADMAAAAVAAPGRVVWDAGPIAPASFGLARAGNGERSAVTWFYGSVYAPMSASMYALLAFFISSAAFRAFRVRSTHAVLLGLTAIVVILGSVPVGEAVWSRFPDLVGWIMTDLQTAGKRAILIGAALGAIATGVKMITGTEKSYLSTD